MDRKERVFQCIGFLPADIAAQIYRIPNSFLQNMTEIHIRCQRPISCTCAGKEIPIQIMLPEIIPKKITRDDCERIFRSICRYSQHRYQSQIAAGYIPLPGGHRVGLSGSAVRDDAGSYVGMADFSSFCIRISNEYIGCAKPLFNKMWPKTDGILIVGLPATGKTTLLRDFVRLLSYKKRVVVIDEKGEIGAAYNGSLQNDLGPNTDVLTGYEKAKGIPIAVKNLAPQVVACDEIGLNDDILALERAMIGGVDLIATIHGTASSVRENQLVRLLAQKKILNHFVFLRAGGAPTTIERICEVHDLYGGKDNWSVDDCDSGRTLRIQRKTKIPAYL